MNALKKIARIVFLLIAFISVSSELAAQRRVVNHLPRFDKEPYHFGFIIALNQMNLTYKPVDNYQSIVFNEKNTDQLIPSNSSFLVREVTAKPIPGFGVGIVGNLRLNDFFDLRLVPTLSFGERIFIYKPNNMISNSLKPIDEIRLKLPSYSVDIPLMIKFRSKRYNNFASYLLVGLKYSLEMAANKNNIRNQKALLKFDRNDLAIDVGVGFDFYTPYFKFGTELKMSYGLRNILIKDDLVYSQVIDRINNKMFQLAFTFE